jgi:hypothetical protein
VSSDLTAAQMVGMGVCSAQCLTSTGTEVAHCGCSCRGQWHGLLAKVTVPGTADARPAPPDPVPGQEDVLAHLGLTDDEAAGMGLPVETGEAA